MTILITISCDLFNIKTRPDITKMIPLVKAAVYTITKSGRFNERTRLDGQHLENGVLVIEVGNQMLVTRCEYLFCRTAYRWRI